MRHFVVILGLYLAATATVVDAASCSANNEVGDSCSIDCAEGQAAECYNGTGANPPQCRCTGEQTEQWRGIGGTMIDLPSAPSTVRASAVSRIPTLHETNINQVINARLSALRDYHLANRCEQVVIGRRCEPSICRDGGITPATLRTTTPQTAIQAKCTWCYAITERRCERVMGKLSLKDVVTVEAPPTVDVGEPNWKGIPKEFRGLRESYKNCNPIDQQYTYQHKEETKLGAKVIKSEIVKTGASISTDVSFNWSVGGKLGAKFDRSVTITEGQTEDYQTSETLLFTLPVIVPGMSLSTLEHFFITREIPVEFNGTVQVDGAISPNEEGITMLSQVLTDASSRQFKFAGFVIDAQFAEGSTSNHSKVLKPEECSDGAFTIGEPTALSR